MLPGWRDMSFPTPCSSLDQKTLLEGRLSRTSVFQMMWGIALPWWYPFLSRQLSPSANSKSHSWRACHGSGTVLVICAQF